MALPHQLERLHTFPSVGIKELNLSRSFDALRLLCSIFTHAEHLVSSGQPIFFLFSRLSQRSHFYTFSGELCRSLEIGLRSAPFIFQFRGEGGGGKRAGRGGSRLTDEKRII